MSCEQASKKSTPKVKTADISKMPVKQSHTFLPKVGGDKCETISKLTHNPKFLQYKRRAVGSLWLLVNMMKK